MSPALIAGLVKAQAPDHVRCRAQEFVEIVGDDSKIIVQCSCNVRLTLDVTVRKAEAVRTVSIVKPAVDDGS
jgi:hypothetical protein